MRSKLEIRMLMGSALLVSALSGCNGLGGGPTGNPGEEGSPRFEDVQCVPDVSGGKTIVEGQTLSCVFRLEGEAGRTVSSRCEDASGSAIDCGASSAMQLQPFGSNTLPVKDGLFLMPTAGLGSGTRTVVWVANDGENTARYRLEVKIVPDDGVNGSPGVEFNCGGDTDGSVRVSAGSQLTCTVRFVDPDPDSLSWSYALVSGSTPRNEPTPFGGAGQSPHEVVWRWSTQASEAGKTWTYAFTVNDGTAPAVTRNLVVSVE